MEFNEKLQELRKQKQITQEQLAKDLYVSRTAISKWESGRGYPSIDSLKEIAKYFSISLDALLSNEEIIKVAKISNNHLQDLVYGLLDCFVIMFLFIPLFGQKEGDIIKSVSLLELNNIQSYVKIPYIILIILSACFGIVLLCLQNNTNKIWVKYKTKISIGISMISLLFFIVSMQPYCALFILFFLIIKVYIYIKKV